MNPAGHPRYTCARRLDAKPARLGQLLQSAEANDNLVHVLRLKEVDGDEEVRVPQAVLARRVEKVANVLHLKRAGRKEERKRVKNMGREGV